MSCKEVLIEVDSVEVLKAVARMDQQEQQQNWLWLMFEATSRIAVMYRKEDWTNEELFETPEKWVEWVKNQDGFEFLKAKVVFL